MTVANQQFAVDMGDDSGQPRAASRSPTPDELFDALSDVHRRYAIYTLRAFGPMTFDDLADVVTGWLFSRKGETALRSDRRRVATSLHHVHIPKLLETALVTRDDKTGIFAIEIADPQIDELLDSCQANERRFVSSGDSISG